VLTMSLHIAQMVGFTPQGKRQQKENNSSEFLMIPEEYTFVLAAKRQMAVTSEYL
jgi:hypothetical protein